MSHGQAASQGVQQHRKQLLNASGHGGASHSHSQQVLDNSQAIKHKISMYSNQVNSKKQNKKLEHSPMGQKQGSSNSTRVVVGNPQF